MKGVSKKKRKGCYLDVVFSLGGGLSVRGGEDEVAGEESCVVG